MNEKFCYKKTTTPVYPLDFDHSFSIKLLQNYFYIHKYRHEDGTVKLWETSGVYLNFIYAIKTHRVFSKTRNDNVDMTELDHPFKISCVYINADYLVVAAYGGHVTLYKYVVKKLNPVDEELGDIPVSILGVENFLLYFEPTSKTLSFG
jgi:hypothetical protein